MTWVGRYWPRLLLWTAVGLMIWLGIAADRWWPRILSFEPASSCATWPDCRVGDTREALNVLAIRFALIVVLLLIGVVLSGLALNHGRPERTVLTRRIGDHATAIAALVGLVFGAAGIFIVVFGLGRSGFTLTALLVLLCVVAAQLGEWLLLCAGATRRAAFGFSVAVTGLTFTVTVLATVLALVLWFIVAPLVGALMAALGISLAIRQSRDKPSGRTWLFAASSWVLPVLVGTCALVVTWNDARQLR